MQKNSSSIYRDTNKKWESFLKTAIYISTAITIFILLGIIYYIFSNGLPYLNWNFITNIYLENDENKKGILPMIINTMYIIVITLLISVPIAISSAIYMTQYAKQGKLIRSIRFTTEILSGIPSIIFGLFGYYFFCVTFKLGTSILAGSFTMAICILPTVIRTTEEALLSVDPSYKEGAMALGASKLKVILGIILPCALSGITTAIILSIGRIIGESAALLYTSGMAYNMPANFLGHILSSGRTLTLHLYQISKQAASPDAFQIAFKTASILLIIVFLLNLLAWVISRIFKKQ